jgi:hypothetical protein
MCCCLHAARTVQVPGNIRRAEHFCQFLTRLVNYMKTRISVQAVEQENCTTFLASLQEQMAIDGASISGCQPPERQQCAVCGIMARSSERGLLSEESRRQNQEIMGLHMQ